SHHRLRDPHAVRQRHLFAARGHRQHHRHRLGDHGVAGAAAGPAPLPGLISPRQHTMTRKLILSAAALAFAGAAGAHALSTQEPADLVKAAQAEGSIMLYSSEDESTQKATLAAFEKKYGIKGSFIRFPTGPLMQRFNTEHDAGKVQADVVSVSSTVP